MIRHAIRTIFVSGLIFMALIPAPSVEAQRLRPVRRPQTFPVDRIDGIVAAARGEEGIPGVVVAIGLPDGSTFEKAYGWFSIEDLDRLETDRILQVGSLAKQFTGAAIMRLVERSEIRLADSIDIYIPELAPRSYGVTVSHLLTHTSGLPNYLEFSIDPWSPITHQEVLDWILSQPISFTPGTSWEYSNVAYYLLGVIIERISGQSYAEFLEQEFFLPLGLIETAYCGRPPATEIPEGYLGGGGIAVPIDALDMSVPFAAGALCSTAEDMVRWNRKLSSGQAVSPESYATMTTSGRLISGELTGYGFGLNVDHVDGYSVISHSGTIPGFNAHLLYVKEANVTVAVLTNLFPISGNFASAISREIAELLVPVNTGSGASGAWDWFVGSSGAASSVPRWIVPR